MTLIHVYNLLQHHAQPRTAESTHRVPLTETHTARPQPRITRTVLDTSPTLTHPPKQHTPLHLLSPVCTSTQLTTIISHTPHIHPVPHSTHLPAIPAPTSLTIRETTTATQFLGHIPNPINSSTLPNTHTHTYTHSITDSPSEVAHIFTPLKVSHHSHGPLVPSQG